MMLPARVHNLAGRRFGRLVVEQYVPGKPGRTVWLCRCDCGSLHRVRAWSLVSGRTQSCGCIVWRDLTGQRFGRLVALELAPRGTDGHHRWLTRCDCGAKHVASAASLSRGNTRSCGCLRREVARRNLAARGDRRVA